MGFENLDPTASSPEAEQILAEAQRRVEAHAAPSETPPGQRALIRSLNRGVFWLSKHWLAVLNALAGLFVGGAIVAPIFMYAGLSSIGNLLYAFYRPFCHQSPFRSWFLFGEGLYQPLTETLSIVEFNVYRAWTGSAEAGYKMALCQRDIAIYGALFFAGLVYGGLRRRRKLEALPLWLYFVFGVIPMLLDGGVQWLSFVVSTLLPSVHETPFETIPLMRAITGALFGAGVVAMAYPLLEGYFDDVRALLNEKFGWT